MTKHLAGIVMVALVFGVAAPCAATGWGVGGFAGVSIPVAQDDAENGSVFGGHLKLSLGGMLGIEPNFSYVKDGEWTVDDVDETFEASKFTSFGINILLNGAGPVQAFRLVPFGGVKYYSEDHPDLDRDSRLGWTAGIGIEFGAGNVGFEGRGALELMTLDGGGSRKWGIITGGVNLYFGAL
jgi:hypothetical protein